MKVMVVYCHPVPESFCGSVKTVVVETLQKAGHEVDLLDLYAENFNPVMPAEERRIYNDMKRPDECAYPGHVERLMAVEGLVFVYPTWWYGFPAMLKGWFDPCVDAGGRLQHQPGWGRHHLEPPPHQAPRRRHHVRRTHVVELCRRPSRQAHHHPRRAPAHQPEGEKLLPRPLSDGRLDARKPGRLSGKSAGAADEAVTTI
jgi:putative NADPH-quinone reductase